MKATDDEVLALMRERQFRILEARVTNIQAATGAVPKSPSTNIAGTLQILGPSSMCTILLLGPFGAYITTTHYRYFVETWDQQYFGSG